MAKQAKDGKVFFGRRLPKDVKDMFVGICKATGVDTSNVLEHLMRRWCYEQKVQLGKSVQL